MTIDQMQASQAEGIPEYNWVPPEWRDNAAAPTLDDTVKATPPLADPEKRCDRQVEKFPGEETPADPQSGQQKKFKHGFQKWVHPDSDFQHTDPPLWDDDDLEAARGTLGSADPARFKKLKLLLGRESMGMQRLAVVFEWILCRASEHLEAINEALGNGPKGTASSRSSYNDARKAYIAFLKDLDNHEPHLKRVTPGKSGESGYGRTIKWSYIYPLILKGKIIGAKISIHWNPHSSSNGIPIQHSPPPPPP